MTQVILLEDEKKMTIFNLAQSAGSIAQALESGDWRPPEGVAQRLDLSDMCLLEMPNFLVVLPKDYH